MTYFEDTMIPYGIALAALALALWSKYQLYRQARLRRPIWKRKLPLRSQAYRDLLLRGERQLLTSQETAKVGAWLRDERVTAEMTSEDAPPLFDEMEAVLLELHKRDHLSSADPLWGRIDVVVDRLRA